MLTSRVLLALSLSLVLCVSRGSGDYFGELALLSSDKRAATVTVTQKVRVLVIGRGPFVRMLGKLDIPQDHY